MEARFSAPVQTGPGAHPDSCTMDTGPFPVVKSGRAMRLTPSSPSAVGHERVELYLNSPFRPYGLYRASVPVEGSTLPVLYLIWEESPSSTSSINNPQKKLYPNLMPVPVSKSSFQHFLTASLSSTPQN